jgi:predicted SnoaL-like aldol condensation-catalyzing enzyme
MQSPLLCIERGSAAEVVPLRRLHFSIVGGYGHGMHHSKSKTLLLLSAALLSGALVSNLIASPPLSKNGAAAVGPLEMAFNQKQVAAAFDRYVGDTYTQHNPTVPDGRTEAINLLSAGVANTDIHYEVKGVIADGDMVAVHSRVIFSAEDRGRAVVDIFRFKKGKIVEHWDVAQAIPEHSANAKTMF